MVWGIVVLGKAEEWYGDEDGLLRRRWLDGVLCVVCG